MALYRYALFVILIDFSVMLYDEEIFFFKHTHLYKHTIAYTETITPTCVLGHLSEKHHFSLHDLLLHLFTSLAFMSQSITSHKRDFGCWYS